LHCVGVCCIGKKKESSTAITGEISVKDATVEKINSGLPKNIFAFNITKDDKTVQIAAEKESLQEDGSMYLLKVQQNHLTSYPRVPEKKHACYVRKKELEVLLLHQLLEKKLLRKLLVQRVTKGSVSSKK